MEIYGQGEFSSYESTKIWVRNSNHHIKKLSVAPEPKYWTGRGHRFEKTIYLYLYTVSLTKQQWIPDWVRDPVSRE